MVQGNIIFCFFRYLLQQGPVAQLVRALGAGGFPCENTEWPPEPEGRGFESRRVHFLNNSSRSACS